MAKPRKFTDKQLEELGKDALNWIMEDEGRIFYGEYLRSRGMFNSMVSYYMDCEPYAEYIYKVKEIQVERLMKGALKNKYNPWFTRYLLNVLHNVREKFDTRGNQLIENKKIDAAAEVLGIEEMQKKIDELAEEENRRFMKTEDLCLPDPNRITEKDLEKCDQ